MKREETPFAEIKAPALDSACRMPDALAMLEEEWIVMVHGKEYGPVDLDTLHEWRKEGRVLPGNEARASQSQDWTTASEIPGLFEPPIQAPSEEEPVPSTPPRGLGSILANTFGIYFRGFLQFLCLSLLVIVPSACTQLTSAVLDTSADVDVDMRSMLAGGFGFCMLLLTLAAWPIYVAGIQILTAELKAGRRVGFFHVLNEAIKFWPRVAALCVFVYIAFSLLIGLALGVMALLTVGATSFVAIAIALVLFVFQVWMFGRLFINVLFWQQAAVLGGFDVFGSLRESKALARGRRDLPWYQRPWWRGALVASLWLAFVLALNLPILWPTLRIYWDAISTGQEPQKVMQTLMASSKGQGPNVLELGLSLFQKILQPLVGIAFVLLYLDLTKSAPGPEYRND